VCAQRAGRRPRRGALAVVYVAVVPLPPDQRMRSLVPSRSGTVRSAQSPDGLQAVVRVPVLGVLLLAAEADSC